MSTATRTYDYHLPESLIAAHPLPRRDASRMMVVQRATSQIEHRLFAEFPTLLARGDLVVLNDTKVIPARFFSDDRKVELLFISAVGEQRWKCLVKPGRRMRPGATVEAGGSAGVVEAILPGGERIIQFDRPVDLNQIGLPPIPPYLRRDPVADDQARYQTVYAQAAGAIAAPTAGLHFTPELLAQIPHTFVTLHVGPGTFRPIQVEQLSDHPMHREEFEVTANAAAEINAAQRIVAIGTTTVRVLETCRLQSPLIGATRGATSIFIHPPWEFRATGALLTNFHLPRSTLLALVSAFATRDLIMEAYQQAIAERYRFYSYGDCMLIV